MTTIKDAALILDVEIKADRPDLIPAYQSAAAAGLDLRSAHANPVTIPAGRTEKIHTGIRLNLMGRRDAVGLVFPRSGLSTKEGLVLANTVGVIDADYQGEIIVALKNTSETTRIVMPEDRIAQLVFMPILVANIIEVDHFVSTTERGEGGFGSTDTRPSADRPGPGVSARVPCPERSHLAGAVASLEG